jgi:hypothetical protein
MLKDRGFGPSLQSERHDGRKLGKAVKDSQLGELGI